MTDSVLLRSQDATAEVVLPRALVELSPVLRAAIESGPKAELTLPGVNATTLHVIGSYLQRYGPELEQGAMPDFQDQSILELKQGNWEEEEPDSVAYVRLLLRVLRAAHEFQIPFLEELVAEAWGLAMEYPCPRYQICVEEAARGAASLPAAALGRLAASTRPELLYEMERFAPQLGDPRLLHDAVTAYCRGPAFQGQSKEGWWPTGMFWDCLDADPESVVGNGEQVQLAGRLAALAVEVARLDQLEFVAPKDAAAESAVWSTTNKSPARKRGNSVTMPMVNPEALVIGPRGVVRRRELGETGKKELYATEFFNDISEADATLEPHVLVFVAEVVAPPLSPVPAPAPDSFYRTAPHKFPGDLVALFPNEQELLQVRVGIEGQLRPDRTSELRHALQGLGLSDGPRLIWRSRFIPLASEAGSVI